MIKFENVVKKFNDNLILDNISFEIKRNQSISILGRSGSGKTTITRLMNGLCLHDSGQIVVADKVLNPENLTKIREKIAYVFQDFNLFGNMNVIENVTYKSINIKKQSRDFVIDKVGRLLERFDIDKKIWFNYPNEISGGQKQRIAIIRSIMEDPEILIMDEPTASLDLELCSDMVDFIKEIISSKSITLVTISHNLNFVEKISDYIMFLSDKNITDFVDSYSFFNKNESISADALKFLTDCGVK